MLTSSVFTMLTTSTAVASLEPVARALAPALVSYALRSTLVLVAAWVVATLLRRSAAATRHAVWAVALTTVAVLPLLSRATPPIDVPVRALPSTAPAVSVAPVRPARRTLARAIAQAPSVLASRRAPPIVSHSIREIASHPEPIPATLDLSLVIVAAWMLGTICLVTRSVVGTVMVWRRAIAAEPVNEAAWVMLARDVARALGIRRPVTLLMTGVPTIPVTWGIIYPVVLLPVEAGDWSPARRRAVLLHELAHVARFDAATQLLGQLVLAAMWCNPLTWLAVDRMRAERERACDDVVLRCGTQASTYATDLLTIVRTLQSAGEPGFAALAMARHAELESRLLFILDAHRRRAIPSARRSMLSLAAAAPFILLVAAIHPSARAAPHARVVVPVVHIASSAIAATPPPSSLSTPVAHTLVHASHLVPATPPPTPHPRSDGPAGMPVTAVGSASSAPAQSVAASTRCPVETEFAHGGVSADRGEVASLELEHAGHRVLLTASDGRCVTGRLDGWVILSDDESQVTGLGSGAHLTIADSLDGHARRVVVSRVSLVSRSHDQGGLASTLLQVPTAPKDRLNEPLYVVDGVVVEPVSVGGRPQVSTSSGYPMIVIDINPDDIEKLRDDSGLWIVQQDDRQTRVETGSKTIEPDSVGVELNSVGGVIAYQYFVDGRSRSWTEGAEWFRTTLAELVRETGYNAQSRVATLRAQGGVPAVLDEIRRLRSDVGLRAYFDALLAADSLSGDDVTQAITVAKSTLTDQSDRDRIIAQLKARAGPSFHLGNVF